MFLLFLFLQKLTNTLGVLRHEQKEKEFAEEFDEVQKVKQKITQTEHKLEVFKAKHANTMNSYKQAYYKGKRRIPVNILKKMPGIPC